MSNLHIRIEGEAAEDAVEELRAFLKRELEVEPQLTSLVPTEAKGRRAADPVAIATLVLSIPSAALASADLAERVKLREKLGRLIAWAKRLRTERELRCRIEAATGTKDLDTVSEDELLALEHPPK
jgi:hypothetical protein